MGKNNNKNIKDTNKKPKVKKEAVKNFEVKKKPKNVKDETPLAKQKQKLTKKRVAYIFYTIFCFILVLAIAAVVGYYLSNGLCAEAQKEYILTNGATGIDATLSESPMYANWWYMPALFGVAILLIILFCGRNRVYHLVGFGIASAGAQFLTFYLWTKYTSGLSLYYEAYQYMFYAIGVILICFPILVGIMVLVVNTIRYKHLVKKGVIIENDYMPYTPIADAEAKKEDNN